MKWNNIYFALLAAFVWCACSNNDDDIPGKQNGKAKLSIAVAAKGLMTKADNHELAGEANINNLTALVFDESGNNKLGSKWQPTEGDSYTSEITEVEADTVKVKIAVIANTPEGTFDNISTLNALQQKLLELSSQSQSNLTMSSSLIATKSSLSGDNLNFIGYGSDEENIDDLTEEVALTRIPARLELDSIRTAFAGSKLEGREVKINEVKFINLKTQSGCFSPASWGVVEAANSQRTESDNIPVSHNISDGNPVMDLAKMYTFENTDEEALTSLYIDATLVEAPGWKEQRATFTVPVNRNGIQLGYRHNYIKRNYVYHINVTFTESSFDPEETEAYLNVEVTVANWGYVEQNSTIE